MRKMSSLRDLLCMRRTKHCLNCDGLHTALRGMQREWVANATFRSDAAVAQRA
jgi:hypothetical protein